MPCLCTLAAILSLYINVDPRFQSEEHWELLMFTGYHSGLVQTRKTLFSMPLAWVCAQGMLMAMNKHCLFLIGLKRSSSLTNMMVLCKPKYETRWTSRNQWRTVVWLAFLWFAVSLYQIPRSAETFRTGGVVALVFDSEVWAQTVFALCQ